MNSPETTPPSSVSGALGSGLSEAEAKAYEDAYLSMLLELGSDEEIQDFKKKSSKSNASG